MRPALAVAMVLALAGGARGAPDGASLFIRCAACHLPTGDGVPGSFPSLHAQIAHYAQAPAGREYMVSVITHGLAGPISIAGVNYDDFMPGQGLADDEAAAVLNYLSGTIAGRPSAATPFTAAEVAAIRARHPGASAQDSHTLRPDTPAGK